MSPARNQVKKLAHLFAARKVDGGIVAASDRLERAWQGDAFGEKTVERNQLALAFNWKTIQPTRPSAVLPLSLLNPISAIKPSCTLPNLDPPMLRSCPHHGLYLRDHVIDRVGFYDFSSFDVVCFVQEKAAVNVHGATP